MSSTNGQANSPVTVTTETPKGRRAFREACVFAVVIALIALAAAAYLAVAPANALPFGGWERGLIVVICVWGVFSVITMIRGVPRVSWQLDDEGITKTPRKGDEQFLPWSEVQAIQWGRNRITFQGLDGRLALELGCEAPYHKEAARQFLRQRLGDCFDLGDLKGNSFSLQRATFLMAIAAGCSLLSMAVIVLCELLFNLNNEVAVLCVLFALCIWVSCTGAREYRRSWRARKTPAECLTG